MAALTTLLGLAGCTDRDLRGSGSDSPDGGTYLVVEPNGPACERRIDEEPWPYAVGEPGPVDSGVRSVDCGRDGYGVGVDVRVGTTYRPDYWGP